MNEQKIWDLLITAGMTFAGAAGLMGNLYAESALNPINLENQYEQKLGFTDETYTKAVDSGKYENFVHDSAGYGLAQWTYWSRKRDLLNFARACGRSVGDPDMQIDFLLSELMTCFPGVWNTLLTADSVRAASDAVMLQFERPADTSESARARRAAFGQKYFDMFAQNMPETPPMPDPETPPMPELPSDCSCNCCSHTSESASQRSHTVAAGDTLTAIARKYDTTVQAILEANKDAYPEMTADLIRVGWVLKV